MTTHAGTSTLLLLQNIDTKVLNSINLTLDKLIEDCGTALMNEIVRVDKLKLDCGDVENIIGDNYDFVILRDFISEMNELNFEMFNQEQMNMFEFFDKNDQAKKPFKNRNFINYHV